ncbi:precorrin-3B synthase [Cypionkella sp.]|uniref:precorrin-3B synthase n=1 Tax=Cypionkella sp. TaxID=2811411 RepID=UPI003750CAB9
MAKAVIQGPIIQGPIIQGWCPGALRPMASGDGLVVRVRPHGGRLTQAQARGIADLARRHGNGLIDLSNRANLQLRGVTEASYPALITGLRQLGLIDDSAEAEARRNIIVTPFWHSADPTQRLAAELTAALAAADAPALPAKFGFVLDTAAQPVLRDVSADIWIETGPEGLLLAVQGGAKAVSAKDAVAQALALARWFLDAGGVTAGRGRMAQLLARSGLPAGFEARRLQPLRATLGAQAQGRLLGFDFGQMQAQTLAALADLGALRLTPWRMLLVEGLAHAPDLEGVITRAEDPMLRVVACSGAPACPQALGDTRGLARALAPNVTGLLHVSGCAKGCAHPGPARTLTATPVGFDLIYDGPASGIPDRIALSASELIRDPSLISKAP